MYKLLIVDDNNRERVGISKLPLWRELGFDTILTAKNGKVGYEIAMAESPFLVVADVSMPIMDGLTMAKKIREHYPETRFIFVSCFDDSQYIREAFDVDAFGYILKPVNLEKLKLVVEKILKIDIVQKENEDVRVHLEKQIANNAQVVKEQITRDLLHGGMCNYEVSENIGLKVSRYAIVSIWCIDHFESLTKNLQLDDNIYMYIYGIKQMLDQNKFPKIRTSAFIRSRDSIGVLTFIDSAQNEQEALSECFDYFNIVKEKINNSFEIEVSVFIGGVAEDNNDLHKLFQQAEYSMEYSVSTKNNSIILAEEIRGNDTEIKYDINTLKHEITKIIEGGDVQEFVNKYYPNGEFFAKKSIKNFTVCVMTILNFVLSEMDESLENIFDDGFSIWGKLNDFNSILDIRQWVTNILKFTAEHISEKKTDRYTKMVEDIKRIIENQYAQIENIDQVSAQIYMSTVHANTVFKRETGQTIFEYLTKIRMEKAKLMLRDKTSRVYLVAEDVGYKSKTYFASLFKEYTGMTPREYRDKFC